MSVERWLLCLLLCVFAYTSAPAAQIEILRDHWGVPHIYSASVADAAFGLGYAHAEDDCESILRTVVAARGESARHFGGTRDIEQDLRLRMFRIPEIARNLYRAQPDEIRSILDGYAAGVNHYLQRHPGKKPAWFDRMTGLDEMAIFKWYQLAQGWTVARNEIQAAGAEPAGRAAQPEASNMWAVGPSRSKDGSVMLLSDPHLPWSGLTRQYEQHLVVGGKKHGDRWIYGSGIFGFFVMAVGFTPDVAWGSTNNSADIADVYRETLHPEDPTRYRYEGEWREMDLEEVQIEVRGRGAVSRLIRRTHHGPVVRQGGANTVYTVRVAGLESAGFAVLIREYLAARNVEQHLRSNRNGDHFKWHRIAVDREGNMGYAYFAATHQRDDRFDWRRPVDGSIAGTEWGPRIPWDRLPRMVNPPAGVLVNCNNNPYTNTPDSPLQPESFPKHLADQSTRLPPMSRVFRARELIDARRFLDMEDMKRISMDVKAMAAGPYLTLIRRAFEGVPAGDLSAEAVRALATLKEWDLMATRENRAVPILTTFLEVAGPPARLRSLTPELVRQAFIRALDTMKERWGSSEIEQGSIHVLKRGSLVLPLAGAGNQRAANPFVTLYMTGASRLHESRWIADQGSAWMMLVRYPAPGNKRETAENVAVGQAASPIEREEPMEAWTVLPWGVSENPDSPHYQDQAPLFANRRYKKALLLRSEIEAHLESRTVLLR